MDVSWCPGFDLWPSLMRLLRLACLSCAMVAGVWGRGVGVAVLTFDVCYTNDLYFELATRSDAVLMIFASTQPTEVTLRHWSMRDDCAEAGRHQLPGASWPPYPEFSQKLRCSIAVLEYQRVHIVCLLCMYHLIYIYIYIYPLILYIYIYTFTYRWSTYISGRG